MIYYAILGAMVCMFACGYCACHLIHYTRPKDQCQPALDQLTGPRQDIAEFNDQPLPKKELRKPVLRRQWSEDMPAKDSN